MKKIINRLPLHKIRNRFLLTLIVLSIPPLFLVGIISYKISSDSIIENYTNYYHEQLKTFNERIDYVFNSIIKMNRYILSNSQLQQQLTTVGLDKGEQYTTYQLQTIMSDYIVERKYIDSVCLVDTQYRAICNGRSDNLGVYEVEEKRSLVEDSDWYDTTVGMEGKEVFFDYNVIEPGDTDTFSTVKWLLDPRDIRMDNMGFLIININNSLFHQPNEGDEGKTELMVINNEDDNMNMLYASDPSVMKKFNDYSSIDSIYHYLEEEKYIYNQYQNETTGWELVHIIQEKHLLAELHSIRNITFLIASIIALIAIILSVVLSKTITNPLEKLKEMMIRWSKGEFGFKEKFNNDEVGQIGETFKKMAINNKHMMENIKNLEVKEREAELRVLQAHINPHFLYNTLDSIYWMAIINKQNDIAEMTISLSESFKIMLSKGKTEIPISEEIKHIDYYMTIQNVRYNNRFTYIKEIDNDIKEKIILKLLLQPLVENSIYHGLEKKIGLGKIMIRGKQYKGKIEFYIADDGVGMEDTRVIYQGYGTNNIKERLEIYYGTTSSFKVRSVAGKGTVVRIQYIPHDKGV